MTDSSIGSKICLNTESKNLLGMFNPPNKIYIKLGVPIENFAF